MLQLVSVFLLKQIYESKGKRKKHVKNLQLHNLYKFEYANLKAITQFFIFFLNFI